MKYKVGKSSIQGKGLIVKEPFKEGELIGLAHINNQPTKIVGLNHNHSDEPTAGNIEVGNKRYLVALRNLKPGEEITTNYREQPELEQPEDFEKKKGGAVSMPTDKPEKSKKFSRSLDATNRLFTENNLFKRPKSRKNKVFDPKAKYYKKGGALNKFVEGGEPCDEGFKWNERTKRCEPITYLLEFADPEKGFYAKFPKATPATIEDLNSYLPWAPFRNEEFDNYRLIGYNWNPDENNGLYPFREPPKGQIVYNRDTKEMVFQSDMGNKTYGEPTPLTEEQFNFWGQSEPAFQYPKNYGNVKDKNAPEKRLFYDPNSGHWYNANDHYKKGGALLTKKVTCKKCGWEWDAADGGDDITTCHKCGGQGLIHAQGGGDIDGMTAMMKARLAYADMHGNPAAKRMINIPDNPYEFDNGDTGTHYMASMDNYAVPQIQDENGILQLGDYGPESNEAIRFDSDEDANYFAENYKDVSPGFLNQKQQGGESGCPNNMIWDEATQSCVSANETTTEEVGFDPIDMWAEDYEQKNPRGSYVYDKKQEYLKKTNRGLSKLAGITLDNFPKEVEDQINEKYNYNMNGYITDRMAKVKKFNPNKHDEWVDELGDRSKEVVANSKYGSKLQPSLWARSLAGAQELGNFVVKQLPGTQGDVFNKQTAGLTKKEWNEIHNSSTGALETLSAADVPGAVVANYLKNSKKDNPNIFSGELMSNVDAVDAMAMNPFLYTAAGEMMAGKSLLGLTADALKPGAKYLTNALGNTLGTESGLLSKAYKVNPLAVKENPNVLLHRVQKPGQTEEYITKHYGKETQPGWGRAFSSDPVDMSYYTYPTVRRSRGYTEAPEILRLNMAKKDIDQYNIYNFNKNQKAQNLDSYAFTSYKPNEEFVLPIQDIIKSEKFGLQDIDNLYKDYKKFNTPHWLKGYQEVPLELPSSPNVSAVTEPFEIAKRRIVNSSDNINRIIRKPEPIAKPNYGQQEFAFPTDAPIPSARLSNEEQMIDGMERARLAKNEEGTALNPSVSIDKPYKVNSPDYYLDIMKMNKYNGKNKQYFIDLVESVKRQGNVASEKQFDELQRIKSGDYSRGKKGYAEGGATLDLTEDEINAYKEGGWVVEYVD
jgi:hypothetical protein